MHHSTRPYKFRHNLHAADLNCNWIVCKFAGGTGFFKKSFCRVTGVWIALYSELINQRHLFYNFLWTHPFQNWRIENTEKTWMCKTLWIWTMIQICFIQITLERCRDNRKCWPMANALQTAICSVALDFYCCQNILCSVVWVWWYFLADITLSYLQGKGKVTLVNATVGDTDAPIAQEDQFRCAAKALKIFW